MKKKEEKKFADYFKTITHKLPRWSDLPEIDLYMDQVIALMEKYIPYNEKILTPSMINNYVKLRHYACTYKKEILKNTYCILNNYLLFETSYTYSRYKKSN